MKDGIHIRIVTAASTVYDDMVSYVELPFSGGSVGVLKDHAPMLGAIEDGVVRPEGERRYGIHRREPGRGECRA